MSNSDTVSTIYNARNNLMKLLDTRGYDISEYDEFSITDVNLIYQNNCLRKIMKYYFFHILQNKIY